MATPKNKTVADEAAAKAAEAAKEAAEKAAAIEAAEKTAEAAKEAEAIAAAEAVKEAAEKAAAKKQPVKALQVVAKVDSFRRGGIVFGRTETTVRLDELSAEQVEQIKGEPLLAVTEIEVAAE